MKKTKVFNGLTLFLLTTAVGGICYGAESDAIQSLATPCSPEQLQEKAENVTLQETLEKIYMQNATLDAARAGLRATDENVSQANAQWRPSLSVTGTQQLTQQYPIGSAAISGARNHGSITSYTATINQNVYQGGKTEATIGQTESQVLQGRSNLFVTEQETLFKGVQAHTSILAAEAIVNYRKESLEFNKKNYERTLARYEVGEESRTDVEAAKGNYEEAKADLSEAIGRLEDAKAVYLNQVGSPPGKLTPANLIVQLPKTYEEVLEVAQAQNPAIIAAGYAVEAANYFVDVQMAGLLPVVDVQGNVGNTRQISSTGTFPGLAQKNTNLSAVATVTVPIYAQGIPNSQVRQAYQQVAQAKVEFVGTQRQVVQDARTAWDGLIAARDAVKGFLAQVKAQELAVEGAYEEVNVGTKTVIDVLELQQKLIDAQVNLANSQKQLVDAGYAVLQAMGRLMARDMKLNVKYYDPDAYYNEYKDAWIQFWKGKDWRYVKNGGPQ